MKKASSLATLFLFLFCTVSLAQQKDYLYYIQTHADNLIKYGTDQYGSEKTNLLASVIDTRDMSVPQS